MVEGRGGGWKVFWKKCEGIEAEETAGCEKDAVWTG
jgi:hypothetical protein